MLTYNLIAGERNNLWLEHVLGLRTGSLSVPGIFAGGKRMKQDGHLQTLSVTVSARLVALLHGLFVRARLAIFCESL